MKKIIHAIITTMIFGFVGSYIGAMFNKGEYLSIIFAITTMGAFILHSIENKK